MDISLFPFWCNVKLTFCEMNDEHMNATHTRAHARTHWHCVKKNKKTGREKSLLTHVWHHVMHTKCKANETKAKQPYHHHVLVRHFVDMYYASDHQHSTSIHCETKRGVKKRIYLLKWTNDAPGPWTEFKQQQKIEREENLRNIALCRRKGHRPKTEKGTDTPHEYKERYNEEQKKQK